MTVSPTEGVAPGLLGQPTSSTNTSNNMDKNTFLQLMVAQLRYQDPMNPTDSSQFLAQTAQFTALEKMQSVADQTAQMVSAQIAFGAAGLVGKQVTYPKGDSTATGTVSGVRFESTGPVLQVDGVDVPLAQVQTVTNPGSTPVPTPAP